MIDLQNILNKYGVTCDLRVLLEKWNEGHRHYNGLDHLTNILSKINEDYGNGNLTSNEREKLIISALFHNIIYEVGSDKNEERSAEFFIRLCKEKYDIDVVEIKQIILDTTNHIASTPLSEKFIKYDLSIFESDFDELLKWEDGIRKEYSIYENDVYKSKRIEFLESLVDKYPMNMDNLLDLINWVKISY